MESKVSFEEPKVDLETLSLQMQDFQIQVDERFKQILRLLSQERPHSMGSRITRGMNTRMRNSFKRFVDGAKDTDSSLGGEPFDAFASIPEGDEDVKERPKPKQPPGSSRSSLQSSTSSRQSFVRKSTVQHRKRALSQATRLRSMKVSINHMPVKSTEFTEKNLRYYAGKIVGSSWFTYGITFIILLNVILLGIEVDVTATMAVKDVPTWFGTANTTIVVFFIVEIVLKFLALGCWDFWFGEDGAWNFFEFLIIVVSVGDVVVDWVYEAMSSSLNTGQLRLVRSIRLARALRSMRVMRLFRYVGALRTLVLSIISTMGSLLWTLALLVLIFYSFGVMLTQLVIDHCRYQSIELQGDQNAIPQCEPVLDRYWSNVPESMLTLFMAISGGVSWDDAVRPLRSVSTLALGLVIFYVVISVFAVLNVVTGVFCNTAIESATIDKDVATIKQVQARQHQVEHLQQIFQEIDRDNVREVSFQDVQEAISSGELSSFMEAVGISTDDIWTLCMLLDADKNGTLDLEEFVSGCIQLHGPAKSLQIAKMSFENKLTRQAIKNLGQETVEIRAQLQELHRLFYDVDAEKEAF